MSADSFGGVVLLGCWVDSTIASVGLVLLVFLFLGMGYMLGWNDGRREEREYRSRHGL